MFGSNERRLEKGENKRNRFCREPIGRERGCGSKGPQESKRKDVNGSLEVARGG